MKAAILLILVSTLTVSEIRPQSPRRGARSKKSVPTPRLPPCLSRIPADDEFLQELKEEWRVATRSSSEIYYYNTRKMVCEKGVLKVWVKTEEIGKGATRSMSHYEVNCNGNQLRVTSETYYDVKGNEVGSTTNIQPTWQDLIPDSVRGSIVESVCHKKVHQLVGTRDETTYSGTSSLRTATDSPI